MKKHVSLFIILLMLIVFASQAQSTIARIEPPFWWTGMKNENLQILVYGNNISHLKPEINYKGVTITETVRVSNPNYLFMYLKIKNECKPGTCELIFTGTGKSIIRKNFELKTRDAYSSNREGFNSSDVIYLITPDRFANGDPDNDENENLVEKIDRQHEGGRHGGDIAGIINHLDYIENMGFTAVWINPLLENNMDRYSYHGYSTTDFYKTDARYGNNELYRELSVKAGQKNIKLIMDMIMNHCGSEHWFVKDPPTKDWINFNGEYVNTNHRRQTVQDIHASEYDKMKFADGWFVKSMPDLNQKNKLMADYLIQNSIWWIEYAGLAGIRMDTYPYPDKNFMTHWSCAIMNEYPNFNIVGEEWSHDPAIIAYWQTGNQNHDGYTSCLPSLMDFPIQQSFVKGLKEDDFFEGGIARLYKTMAMDFLYPDPDNLVVFPDNHDMDRFFTQVGHDFDFYKMGIVYFLTIRGIPQIYYGTEILMHNTGYEDNHGVIRTDFPGGWMGDDINAFTGKGLDEQQLEAQKFMKKLLNWRKNKKVIHSGKLMQFAPEDGIYVYFRYDDSDVIMIILNKNEHETEVELAQFNEMLNGFSSAQDMITTKKIKLEKSVMVPTKSALILELE